MYHVIVIAYRLLGLHRTITASRQAITPQKQSREAQTHAKVRTF